MTLYNGITVKEFSAHAEKLGFKPQVRHEEQNATFVEMQIHGCRTLAMLLVPEAGARYTSTKDEATICNYANGDGNVALLFDVIPTLVKLPLGGIGPGGCYALNNLVPTTSPHYFQPGDVYRNTLKEHNVSWRVGPDFHVNDNVLLYANASRGYKAGSFPTLAGSTFSENNPVTQESVTAYEFGMKSSLLDRRMQFNAAAFYYDYKDKQIRGKLVDPIFNILDVLINVPKSRVYGAEGDLTVKPIDNLTVQAAVTFLKSEITNYTGPTVYGETVNFAGTPLPFTPRWVGSFDAEYRLPLSSGAKPFVGVTVTSQSSAISQLGGENIAAIPAGAGTCGAANLPACYKALPGLTRPFVLPGYSLVDLRLGYEAPSGRWTAMLWGKNVLNKYYFTSANQYLDVTSRYAGLPATYGLSVSFRQ